MGEDRQGHVVVLDGGFDEHERVVIYYSDIQTTFLIIEVHIYLSFPISLACFR